MSVAPKTWCFVGLLAVGCSKSQDPDQLPGVNAGSSTTVSTNPQSSAQASSSASASTQADSTGTPDPKLVQPGPMQDLGEFACGEIKVDAAWLRARVGRLSGWVDAQIQGKTVRLGERHSEEGRAIARSWLREQYEKLGYKVQEQPYAHGVNLIADKPGASASYYVISSHYDTVPGTVGADDDATGVITGLAIAAALAPCKLEVGVKFIAFDQEERKMTGAYHFARNIANDRKADLMLGAIQVEMTGYDSDGDGAFNIVDCQEPRNTPLTQAIEAAIAQTSVPVFPVSGCTNRSDHQAFWSIDRPAVAVSELFFADVPDRTRCYHQSCDRYDQVNFDYMDKLNRVLTQTTLNLTRTPKL